MSFISQLYEYRELYLIWTWREVRVRYKQSLLGIAWAFLQPLSMMLIFTLVFTRIVQIPTGDVPYPLFSYAALLPWTFFTTAISQGIPSLVNNLNLVTKVKMPREVLPVSVVLAGLVDFVVAGLIFAGLLIYYRVDLTLTALWALPLLFIQIILTLGVVLAGSALLVLFRDVRFIIPLFSQLWMYATPIIYPVELVPERFRIVYYLNPMAGIIDGYRQSLLHGQPPDALACTISAGVAILLIVLAYWFFKRIEPIFADII